MTELTMREFAETQASKLERERAQNRANFPGAGRVMDALAQFKPRLIYAEENGRTIGRVP